jgi:soluble cytochrome b562
VGGVRIGCSVIHKSELAKEIQLKRSSRAECEWNMKDWQAAMDEIEKRGCWGIKFQVRKGMGNPKRVYSYTHSVHVGGLRIRCSNIHKSELEKEIKLRRSSRAECEWTMKDWQAAMDEIKKRGSWGMVRNPKRVCSYSYSVPLGGLRMRCFEIHKSELAKEIKLKRSSRAECEWTMKDWRAAMDEIKKRECWGGVKCHKRPRREAGNCVGWGGVLISCSNIHKSELEQEIHLKRSSRAECEWTMKDWQAAMDEIKKRGCWGSMSQAGSRVTVGGVRIGCSKIHKSELEKEIKLKRCSRAECEWTMEDWQVAMDQIKNRGCWGVKYYHNGH